MGIYFVKFTIVVLVLSAITGWSLNPHACCPHNQSACESCRTFANCVQSVVMVSNDACSSESSPTTFTVNEPIPKGGGFNTSDTTPASLAAVAIFRDQPAIITMVFKEISAPDSAFISPPEQPPRLQTFC